MQEKLFDSELKIMQLIWQNEPVRAKKVSLLADDAFGWNKNTTYTVLKKLEAKGFIKREDPGFVCTSLVSRDEVRSAIEDKLCAVFWWWWIPIVPTRWRASRCWRLFPRSVWWITTAVRRTISTPWW